MVSKNCSRLLFRPYFSKLVWDAKVICRIVLPFHLQLTTLSKLAVDQRLVQRLLKAIPRLRFVFGNRGVSQSLQASQKMSVLLNLRDSMLPKTFRYSPTIHGVGVDRLRRA